MKLFGWDISKRSKVVFGNPNSSLAQWLEGMGYKPSYTGQNITDKNSLTLSAVYAAVRILSETVAALPIDLYKYTSQGKEQQFTDASRLISVQPNEIYTSYIFRQAMQACVTLYGNAYAFIDFNKSMKPIKLTILDPQKVTIKQIEETKEIFYMINETVAVEPWQMLHIKGFTFDGIVGVSPIDYQREAIANGLALQEYGNRFFGQGSLMTGVITRPGTMTADTLKGLRTEWNRTYKGRDNQHQVAILDAGMDFKSISVAPEQAQFIASRNYNVEDIARIFRIPQHLLQKLDRSTNNNIEQQSLEFITFTMLPWLKNWESELTAKLSRKADEGFKFNVNALMRGDVKSRADYYVKMIQNGVMSPNEVRRLEDFNAREGGDIYLTPMNMTTNPESDE